MQLSKPFDGAALVSALKAKGIQDAEALVNNELPVVFDWLNSSIQAEASTNPWVGFALTVALPMLQALEARAQAEINTKLGA